MGVYCRIDNLGIGDGLCRTVTSAAPVVPEFLNPTLQWARAMKGCRGHIVLLSCLLLFAVASLPAAAETFVDATRMKRVVVLYSAPLDFPATEMAERGIREVLLTSRDFQIQLFSEYLDLSRFRDARQREALVELLRYRYAEGATDLVISVDVPAANFLLEHAGNIFPGVPMVMCSIPEVMAKDLKASPLRERISGVFEPTSATSLVETALSLKPDTKHVALIAGAFENDLIRAIGLRRTIEALGNGVQLILLEALPIAELVEKIRQLPKDAIIFFSTFFVDGTGRSFVPRDVLKVISEASKVPLFGLYESYLGYGIVGGRLISFQLQGKRAAELGLAVLAGQSPAAIPFDDGLGTCLSVYDWRQLQRWGVRESSLPPGSEVKYRESSVWELYKGYIIGAGSLLILEAMLIIALIINLQQRKKAEVALRESRQDLRTLAGRLISAQEEELSRLSREFHDDIAQRLAAVAIESGTLELRSQHIDDTVLDKIRYIKEQLITLSEDVSTISRQIHPAILKDLGLVRAINSQCVRFSDREGIDVDFQAQDVPDTVPKGIALCLYRIIQESLRNIAKHSQATRVEISLKGQDERILLHIIDDGAGFVPREARRTPGIGLASMRERVEYVNGQFEVRSDPGMGTMIEVSVPMTKGNT